MYIVYKYLVFLVLFIIQYISIYQTICKSLRIMVMKPLLVKIDFIDLTQIQETFFTFLAPPGSNSEQKKYNTIIINIKLKTYIRKMWFHGY